MQQGYEAYQASAERSAQNYSLNEDIQRSHLLGQFKATLELIALQFPEVDAHLAKLAKV